MSDASPSRTRTSSGSKPSTPLGIKILVVFGLFGALMSLLGGLGLLAQGGIGIVLGLLVLVLGVAQGVVMFALLQLAPWSWYAAVALYALSALANLLQGQLLATLISLGIAAYVFAQKDLFERAAR